MGASADLIVQPFGALLIGCIAAAVSVFGYAFVQVMLYIGTLCVYILCLMSCISVLINQHFAGL